MVTIADETVDHEPWATIRIGDEGIGIPEDEIDAVFGRFRRATNARDLPGSGLGLWSVRRIVEQHGGVIEARSQVGSGTEVTLRLPVRTHIKREPSAE